MTLLHDSPTLTTATAPPLSAAAPTVVGWPTVLRQRHCTRLLGATLLGRLPLGMAPVVLLLAARDQGGSYTWGAVLAGVFGLAVAAGQPLLGRIVDRMGQRVPIVVGALVSAAAFAAPQYGRYDRRRHDMRHHRRYELTH